MANGCGKETRDEKVFTWLIRWVTGHQRLTFLQKEINSISFCRKVRRWCPVTHRISHVNTFSSLVSLPQPLAITPYNFLLTCFQSLLPCCLSISVNYYCRLLLVRADDFLL